MIKLLWRTDVHISDKGPMSRKDDWTEAVLDKLNQIGQLTHHLKIDGVIDGGDFFHEKSPRLISHKLIKDVVDLHKKYYCPVWCNVGNHDVVRGNIENLPRQPLEVLFSTGVFKRNYDEHEAVFERDDVKVRVVGVPYHGTRYDMDRLLNIEKKDENYLMVSAHLLASPAGGSMFGSEDIVSYKDLLKGQADIYAFGHYHADQGITQISEKKWVINTGSLTRGSLSEDNLKRKPKIVLMDFTSEELKLTPVNLKIKPPEEVFDLEEKVKFDARSMIVEDFVKRIQDTLSSGAAKSLEEEVSGMELPEKVRERVLYYLEQ